MATLAPSSRSIRSAATSTASSLGDSAHMAESGNSSARIRGAGVRVSRETTSHPSEFVERRGRRPHGSRQAIFHIFCLFSDPNVQVGELQLRSRSIVSNVQFENA